MVIASFFFFSFLFLDFFSLLLCWCFWVMKRNIQWKEFNHLPDQYFERKNNISTRWLFLYNALKIEIVLRPRRHQVSSGKYSAWVFTSNSSTFLTTICVENRVEYARCLNVYLQLQCICWCDIYFSYVYMWYVTCLFTFTSPSTK